MLRQPYDHDPERLPRADLEDGLGLEREPDAADLLEPDRSVARHAEEAEEAEEAELAEEDLLELAELEDELEVRKGEGPA